MRLTRALLLFIATSQLPAAMTVSLKTSNVSPVPLGTPVTWTVTVSGVTAGSLLYRFKIEGPNGGFRTVVDYGPKASLTWTTIDQEGSYRLEVGVIDTDTSEQSSVASGIFFSSLVSGTTPVVTPSANPMVYIYSAPPCQAGDQMRVRFQAVTGPIAYTPYQTCVAGVSRNFYLAGMLPGTAYQIQHVFATRGMAGGPTIKFSVPPAAADPPTFTQLTKGTPPPGLLLQSLLGSPALATAAKRSVLYNHAGN